MPQEYILLLSGHLTLAPRRSHYVPIIYAVKYMVSPSLNLMQRALMVILVAWSQAVRCICSSGLLIQFQSKLWLSICLGYFLGQNT